MGFFFTISVPTTLYVHECHELHLQLPLLLHLLHLAAAEEPPQASLNHHFYGRFGGTEEEGGWMSLRPHLKHHFYCQLGGPQEEGDEGQVHLITTFMADWVSQRRGEEPQAHLNHHSCGRSGGPEA